MDNAMECNNKECEYICDAPFGSYCTLTNEPVETTRCHYEEQKDLEPDFICLELGECKICRKRFDCSKK